MKLTRKKKIIASVTAIVLAVTCGITTVFAHTDIISSVLLRKSAKSAAPYQLDMSDIKYDPDAKREDYDNNLEYLLARDGFIYGVDYAWQGMNLYSSYSLGDQNIFGNGGLQASFNDFIAFNDIYNMRALGFNATNYWLLQDMNGVLFDENGYCIGLQEVFKKNLKNLLQACRDADMFIIPTLQPHGYASSYENINESGLSPNDVWNKYFKYIWNDEARDAYMTNVIDPILDILAEYEDIILMVGLTIENTASSINDVDYGYVYNDLGTSWENWTKFHNALSDRVKLKLGDNMLTSIEEQGDTEKLYRYNDLNVDILGANNYHSKGGTKPREDFFTTRPGYIGECNISDGAWDGDISGAPYGGYRQNFYVNARENGWLGAFLFQWTSQGDDCNLFKTDASTLDYEALYYWMVEFRKIFTDNINEYRGVKSDLDKPYLLANKGTDDVYWTPSFGAVSYKLERSVNGGKWTTIAENIDPDFAAVENSLLHFVDSEKKNEGDKTQYRVTAIGEDGKTAVSDPNNECAYYIAKNVLKNGSFEGATKDGDTLTIPDWTVSNKYFDISADEHTDGEISLKMNYAHGEKEKGYANIYQTIALKPNTAYFLEYKYKIPHCDPTTESGTEATHIIIREKESRKEVCTKGYLWQKTVDPSDKSTIIWQTGTMMFTVGSNSTVDFIINFGNRSEFTTYLDEITLKEMR